MLWSEPPAWCSDYSLCLPSSWWHSTSCIWSTTSPGDAPKNHAKWSIYKTDKIICLFSLIFYCFLCYGRSEINNDDELQNGGPTNFFKGVFFNATIKQFSDFNLTSQWMSLSELLQASTDFSFFCFSASSASIFFTSFTFSRAHVCRQINSSKKCLTFTFQRPFLMQNVLFYNSHNL